MSNKIYEDLWVENAEIGYKNFAGNVSPVNLKGNKTFSIFFEEDVAKQLEEQGWNIKWPKPNPDIDPADDRRKPHLPVEARFDNYPPKVAIMNYENPVFLENDTINQLDSAIIEKADVLVRPYNYVVSGREGVKAYLKSLYVTLREDEGTRKYGF